MRGFGHRFGVQFEWSSLGSGLLGIGFRGENYRERFQRFQGRPRWPEIESRIVLVELRIDDLNTEYSEIVIKSGKHTLPYNCFSYNHCCCREQKVDDDLRAPTTVEKSSAKLSLYQMLPLRQHNILYDQTSTTIMYDDASYYYSFNASAQASQGKTQKHQRKQSSLEKPDVSSVLLIQVLSDIDNSQEEFHADARQSGGLNGGFESIQESTGPPKATLARRAQSYSDFHDAVTVVLGRNPGRKGKSKRTERRRSQGGKDEEHGSGIQTELDFSSWYDELESELLDSSHDVYTTYQKQLESAQSHLDSLLSDTNSTLDLLASLRGSFKEVEAQTTIFQKQCEGLLDEQRRVEGLAEDLDHNLKYYGFLEPVTRRLNAPGAGNFVKSKDFSEMLARLDECLDYMAAHVSHGTAFRRSQTDVNSPTTENREHTDRATAC